MPTPADPPSLEEIRELNSLFLKWLQVLDTAALRESGLPQGAACLLRSASAEMLDAAADFPRALFDLSLEDRPVTLAARASDYALTERQIVTLTVVHRAWNVSRDSLYHARLFFGLPLRVIHRLRTTPLSDLARLASTAARVGCAFPEAEWLWKELLTETRPEARRQLILIALQPSIEGAAAFGRVAEDAVV